MHLQAKKFIIIILCIFIQNQFIEAASAQSTVPILPKYSDLADFEHRCAGGDMKSCADAGLIYDEESNVAVHDEIRAMMFYTRACNGGYGFACHYLGFRIETRSPVDYVAADQAYAKGCDISDPMSCWKLGVNNWQGIGVPANTLRAIELFVKSCDLGLSMGCSMASSVYRLDFSSDIVRHADDNKFDTDRENNDLRQGFFYEKKACLGGNYVEFGIKHGNVPTACTIIAEYYRDGYNLADGGVLIEKNIANAIAYFKMACVGSDNDNSDGKACFELAQIYFTQNGTYDIVKQLYTRALALTPNDGDNDNQKLRKKIIDAMASLR